MRPAPGWLLRRQGHPLHLFQCFRVALFLLDAVAPEVALCTVILELRIPELAVDALNGVEVVYAVRESVEAVLDAFLSAWQALAGHAVAIIHN